MLHSTRDRGELLSRSRGWAGHRQSRARNRRNFSGVERCKLLDETRSQSCCVSTADTGKTCGCCQRGLELFHPIPGDVSARA